MYSRTLLKTT